MNGSLVLAVDDDLDDVMLLADAFNEIKQEVIFCSVDSCDNFFSYLFGFDSASCISAQSVPVMVPGLILLDINMPKLNGIELLKIIRSNIYLEDTWVVMLTTSRNPDDQRKCEHEGADLYFVKPSSYSEIKALCARLITELMSAPRSKVMES